MSQRLMVGSAPDPLTQTAAPTRINKYKLKISKWLLNYDCRLVYAIFTNGSTADNAVIDNRWAILPNFKAVMFVMRNRRGNIRAEFERNVAQVRGTSTFHKRHCRLSVTFNRDIFSYVPRWTADNVHICLHHQILALIRAFMDKDQWTLGVVEKFESRLNCIEISYRAT